MLQILDDGRITDAQGRTVNFENAIIIMTTNAGSTNSSSILGFGAEMKQAGEEKTQKSLLEFLRPEFINRVDELITFSALSEENFRNIAKIMLNDLKKVLEDRSISFSYSEEAAAFIAKESFSVKFGARNMRRYISRNIEDIIADKIISSYENGVNAITVDSDGSELIINVN